MLLSIAGMAKRGASVSSSSRPTTHGSNTHRCTRAALSSVVSPAGQWCGSSTRSSARDHSTPDGERKTWNLAPLSALRALPWECVSLGSAWAPVFSLALGSNSGARPILASWSPSLRIGASTKRFSPRNYLGLLAFCGPPRLHNSCRKGDRHDRRSTGEP